MSERQPVSGVKVLDRPRQMAGGRMLRIGLVSFGVLVLLTVLFHPVILRWTIRPLLATPGKSAATALTILGGDRRYDQAAQKVATGEVDEILLMAGGKSWVVACGAKSAGVESAQRLLQARGVSPGQIVMVADPAGGIWEIADRLASWLADHPDATLLVIADQLHGKTTEIVMQRTLPSSAVSRVHVIGLKNRRFDQANWWKRRHDLKYVFNKYVWLIHTVVFGRPDPIPDTWDPDEFESRLRLRLESQQ